MAPWVYRISVIGCALAWFMLGLHVPVLHQVTHHGHRPHWGVLAVLVLLAASGVAALWTLLRAPARTAT